MKNPSEETEARVVDRMREVDAGEGEITPHLAAELDRVFEAHRERIYALCLRMVGDPARAEELVQETLLVAYRKLPGFAGQSRLGTWIYAIARNQCFNAVRKHGELLTEDGVLEAEEPEFDILVDLQRHEREALLTKAAASVLDPQEQEAIYLRYVEGLPQQQISEILGLTGSGARGLLQRCRRKLGRELRKQLSELGLGSSFIRTG